MKSSYRIKKSRSGRSGFTTLELTVAFGAVLLLLGVAYVGARAYKKGADRSGCVFNIYHAQTAVRSYANMRGLRAGETVRLGGPDSGLANRAGVPEPVCPGGGKYKTLGDTVPAAGELYLSCSLAESEGHVLDLPPRW